MPRDNIAQVPGKEEKDARDTTEELPDQSVTEKGERLKEDIDAVLDEIDELLAEEDTEEFVTNYVQKGGE
ncbi:MAG: ubiquitin-like protein Pup [bacterium]|nr:ubiquitin-like protein Pup [bacterium]